MLIHSHYRPGSESANIRVFIHVFIYKPIDSDRVEFGVSISGVEKRRLKNKQKKKPPKPVVKEAEQQPRPAPKELNSPPKPAPKQADQLHSCSPDVSTCSGDIRVAASDDVTELQRLLEKKKQELQLKLNGITAPVQSQGLFTSHWLYPQFMFMLPFVPCWPTHQACYTHARDHQCISYTP